MKCLESSKFLRDELSFLYEADFDFAYLRLPTYVYELGDIDIITTDISKIRLLLSANGFVKITDDAFVRFSQKSNSWLRIDLNNNALAQAGLTNIASEYFVKHADDTKILRTADQLFVHLLEVFHKKKSIKSKYVHLLNQADDLEFNQILETSQKYLDKGANEFLDLVCKMQSRVSVTDRLSVVTMQTRSNSCSLREYGMKIITKIRLIVRYQKPIVICGPDGAGKSTLVRQLAQLEWLPVTELYMGHSDFGGKLRFLSHILSMLHRAKGTRKKRTFSGKIVRIIWHGFNYTGFWLTYFQVLKNGFRGKATICDRYPFDMYFRSFEKRDKLIYGRFFIKPKLVLLCVGDPHLIYKRKPEELTVEQIDDTIKKYRAYFRNTNQKVIEIDTTVNSLEKSLYEACTAIRNNIVEH